MFHIISSSLWRVNWPKGRHPYCVWFRNKLSPVSSNTTKTRVLVQPDGNVRSSKLQVHNENQFLRQWSLSSNSPKRMRVRVFLPSLPWFSDLLKGMGLVVIHFLGPPPNDFLTRKALDILGLYLSSSSVAPLNKEYIEIDSPLWYIYCFQKDRLTYPPSPVLASFFSRRSAQHWSTWNSTFYPSLQRISTPSMKNSWLAWNELLRMASTCSGWWW